MNRLFIILVLTGVLLQSTVKVYVLMNFAINREYIAKNLCVKKAVPGNCCRGKCYLQKQMAKQEEKAPASEENRLREDIQFCQGPERFIFAMQEVAELNSVYLAPCSREFHQSVFRPPARFYM